jgi:prolipoprotein diacylglyceryltransferase
MIVFYLLKKNENQYQKKINDNTDILIFFAIVFCFILCKIYFILQNFHHSLKEHHKISNIPKFRCKML